MDETTINRTKSAINALIDIEQLWIETTPEYNLSTRELVVLKKKLVRAQDNIKKIYDENIERMTAAEEELKKMHSHPKKTKKTKQARSPQTK